MPNHDFSYLVEKIKDLMKTHNMTQKTLGDKIGMEQSNVSKCLSTEDKKIFTLEQVWRIADLFNVSIDELLGRKPVVSSGSAEDVCKLIASLIENRNIIAFKYSASEQAMVFNEETGYYNDDYDHKTQYTAFYFSNYERIPPLLPEEAVQELVREWEAVGNDNYTNIKINKFLSKYVDTYNRYNNNGLSEDEFKAITEVYLKNIEK